MDQIADLESLWDLAKSAMTEGRFVDAAELYGQVIELLEGIESSCEPGMRAPMKQNLANAHGDRAGCLLRTCGLEVSEAAHEYVQAVSLGSREKVVINNLLWCMAAVNANMKVKVIKLPNDDASREFGKWHNLGYDLLKSPQPQMAGNRDWQRAVQAFRNCVEFAGHLGRNHALWQPLLPEYAAETAPRVIPVAGSFHSLGLALEGSKAADIDAIRAWLEALDIQASYDFGVRIVFEFEG